MQTRKTTINDLEILLARIERRQPKHVVGFAPVNSIYSFCPSVPADGIVLRYMFAVAGTITKIFVFCPRPKEAPPLELKAELINETAGQFVDVVVTKDRLVVDVNLPIKEGSRLLIRSPTINRNNIELAALFIPNIEIGQRHQALRAALLESENAEL